ncbi:hypothetical protein L0668_11810 [Paraglaciecola aquimarina]|uniref:Uncharacterized protein n=1 Tax=Paraglaciecola algarum TaxID=3050085 RepID=A0ABS9D775_9ALTE|nr:hypothetical protein [Paraglaciecola sp. G1-23]MCF2948796.1 hypothetical protein [Paraglaciecola sp. G1-23]
MKRKLIRRIKSRISSCLKYKCSKCKRQSFDACQITYDSICRSKQFGQRCHQQRLARQQKMNPRQLKNLRKRQRILGLIGSKYGRICKIKLKPASAILIK